MATNKDERDDEKDDEERPRRLQPEFDTSRLHPIAAAPRPLSNENPDLVDRLRPVGSEEAAPVTTSRLPDLGYKQRQRLPMLSLGVAPGSSEMHENEVARLEDQKQNPMGSAENHPGRLGRIAHVLGRIGNIAGDIVAPGITAMIPGSDLNRNLREQNAETRLGQAQNRESEGRLRAAQTENLESEVAARKAPADFKPFEGDNAIARDESGKAVGILGMNTKTNQPEVRPIPAGMNIGKTDEAKQPIAEAGAAQHGKELETLTSGMPAPEKQRFLDAYAAKGNDTHAIAIKRLEDAKASAALSAGERDRALQRDIAKRNHEDQQAQLGLTNSLQTVEYTDPKSGERLTGSFAEAEHAGAKNARKIQPGAEDKAREFYGNSSRLLQNAQAVSDTLSAWDNPKDKELALRIQKQFVNGLHVPGVGGISGEYIDTFLNSDDYKNMSREGQAHMQNVLQLYSDVLQMIKTETGANPRGEVMFETEKKILPSPEKTQEMNRQAIDQLEKRIRADAKGRSRPTDMGALQGVIPPDAKSRLRDPDTNHVVGYVDKDGKRVVW